MSRPTADIAARWRHFRLRSRTIGLMATVQCALAGRSWASLTGGRWIRPKPLLYPVYVRHRSSDLEVFRRVLIDHDYGCLDGLANVGLVLDCGANVGYSSAYFLTRHARSTIVAVEPDPANLAILQRNLATYGPRARVMHAAVWSHDCRLQMSEEPYRDGRDWSRQVSPFEAVTAGGGG